MTNPYHAGPPLPLDSPLYVERLADGQGWDKLQRMEYVVAVGPRHQGKTSFIHHLAAHCRGCDYAFAYLDLANLDASSEANWYSSFRRELLRLFASVIVDHVLPDLTTSSTWFPFLWELAQIASSCKRRLVIALDEVSAIPGAWATDFFATIRSVYVHRNSMECFKDLTFIIAGVQDPRDVIRDPSISAFNLAHRIILEDFTPAGVQKLVENLGVNTAAPELAERLHYWTGGQPYMCMRLCQYLAEMGGTLNSKTVDAAVDKLFMEDTIHLPRILEDLGSNSGQIGYLCTILARQTKFSPLINREHFRLAYVIGIIAPDEDLFCGLRNRVYMRAMDEAGLCNGLGRKYDTLGIALRESSIFVDPVRILHLSDLHFSSDIDPLVSLQPLVADLRDGKDGLGLDRLDYLVISGDLTMRAAPGEFEKAYEFVFELIKRLKLESEHCIIVPGNHDQSWDEPVYDWKPRRLVDTTRHLGEQYKQQGDIYLVRDDNRYYNRFGNFSHGFCQPLFGKEYPLAFKEQGIAYLFVETGIQFITLNSCWKVDEWFPQRAHIHEGALVRALDRAERDIEDAREAGRLARDANVLRISVLHHPITGKEMIENATIIEQLQKAGIRVCLHGHVHEELADLFNPLHPRKIHVVGIGSFDATASQRPESTPRLYNLLEIARDHHSIRVRTRCRRKTGGPWEPYAIWPSPRGNKRSSEYTINLRTK